MKFLSLIIMTMSLVSIKNTPAFAQNQLCETANHQFQKIDCKFFASPTTQKFKAKIRCEGGKYVFTRENEASEAVQRTITSMMERGVNWELFSFELAHSELMLESHFKHGPGVALPYYNVSYSPLRGEKLEYQGRCWAH